MKTLIPYVICIILLVCLIVSVQTCNNKNRTISDTGSLDKKILNDSCTYYKAKNGDLVSKQNAISVTVATLQNTKDSLTAEIANLKLKPAQIKYIASIVSGISLPHDTIVHDSVKVNKPVQFKDSTQWYSIKGIAEINKTILTNVFIPNTMYLAQKTDGTTVAMNTNPYIKTTNILNVNVVKPKKFYERFWFQFGLGIIAATVTIHELGIKP